jgi:hypothetical protein
VLRDHDPSSRVVFVIADGARSHVACIRLTRRPPARADDITPLCLSLP